MKLLRTCITLAAGLALAAAVHAQAFPSKPVRIVVGFPAGGPLDQHARLLSDKLQTVLGQPVVMDYKAGAGGTVGAQEVMRAPPDGHTIMLANTGVMVINPALYSRLPYATLKDFVPVARTAMQPLALLVNPSVPAKNVAELVSWVKANPTKANYGSVGAGTDSYGRATLDANYQLTATAADVDLEVERAVPDWAPIGLGVPPATPSRVLFVDGAANRRVALCDRWV